MAGLFRRWFPRHAASGHVVRRLEEFYAQSRAYHEMTASGDKTSHPQVRLLSCLIEDGGTYAETGCGSGAVCRMVGRTARAHGCDVSPLAIERAQRAGDGDTITYHCCSAEALPLPDGSVDGAFSFEVLEHLLDPVAAVKEMIRIARPGGFILLSAPNRFSLDLHLHKRRVARAADLLLAVARRGVDMAGRRCFVHVTPDLDHGVYPDCDMVTAVIPGTLAREVEQLGCEVDFWDTTYMCAHRSDSRTTLDFQRNAGHPFLRHFGDHLLLLAHKRKRGPITVGS